MKKLNNGVPEYKKIQEPDRFYYENLGWSLTYDKVENKTETVVVDEPVEYQTPKRYRRRNED